MQIKIPDSVSVNFTGKGIAYILDLLANQPYKDVNGLINDILGQLKESSDGPKLDRFSETTPGGGNTGTGGGGVPPMEGQPADN